MPVEIGSYIAKTKLPEILRRVAEGESFTITNRGKPVAELTPSRSDESLRIKTAIDTLLQSKKHSMSASTLNELKADGRK